MIVKPPPHSPHLSVFAAEATSLPPSLPRECPTPAPRRGSTELILLPGAPLAPTRLCCAAQQNEHEYQCKSRCYISYVHGQHARVYVIAPKGPVVSRGTTKQQTEMPVKREGVNVLHKDVQDVREDSTASQGSRIVRLIQGVRVIDCRHDSILMRENTTSTPNLSLSFIAWVLSLRTIRRAASYSRWHGQCGGHLARVGVR